MLTTALAALLAASCALAAATAAHAGTIAEYQVPAPGAVLQLQADPDGGTWFLLDTHDTGNQDTSTLRVGRADAAGHVSVFGELTGRALFSKLRADGYGGAWVLSLGGGLNPSRIVHVAADGSADVTATQAGLQDDGLAVGPDGAAWAIACPWQATPSCSAVVVSRLGAIASHPLTSIGHALPVGSYVSGRAAFAVAGGVWLNPDVNSNGRVAFVSWAGDVSPVDLPAGATFLAPAGGDTIWWYDAATSRVGQLDPDGSIHDLRTRPAVSFLYFSAGQDHSLLWSDQPVPYGGEGHPPSDGTIGRFAAASVGGDASVQLPWGTATVPIGENFFSGACTFAYEQYEAIDHGLWIVSLAHPNMITYRSPSGALRTFVPPALSAPGGYAVREGFVGELTPTSDGALWFVDATDATGDRLARADPLDPPPGLFTAADWEARYGMSLGVDETLPRWRRPRLLPSAHVRASLRRMLALTAKGAHIQTLLARGRIAATLQAPLPGKLRLTWTMAAPAGAAHSGRRIAIAHARGRFASAGARTTVVVQLTRIGRARLAHVRRAQLVATGSFTPRGRTTVTATRTLTLLR